MEDDPADLAEAIKFLTPNLADEQLIKSVRFNAKNQRDCGAASAVGAATVAITLLIGNGKVSLEAFYVLIFAQSLLIYAAQFFANRSAALMGRESPVLLTVTASLATTAFAALGAFLTSQLRHHESHVGSSSWWWLLGLAFVGAVLGLIVRRSAESLIDELDDESWKHRVAPLVDNQLKAIANMWAFEIRLREFLKSEPQAHTQADSRSKLARNSPLRTVAEGILNFLRRRFGRPRI